MTWFNRFAGRALIVVPFVASLSIGLQAQAAAPPLLTPTDVLQTRLAALEQENARLRSLLAVPCPVSGPAASFSQEPGAPPSTMSLGAAAALAAQIKHEWPASRNTVPHEGVVVEVSSAPTTAPTTSNVVIAPGDPARGEAYWKDRMRTLTTQLANDQAFLAAAVGRERALNRRVHLSLDNVDAIHNRLERAVVEGQWNDAVTDVSRLKAVVANDVRMKADFELEAHRAGALPGWLVLE